MHVSEPAVTHPDTLKMDTSSFSETLVSAYQTTRYPISEDYGFRLATATVISICFCHFLVFELFVALDRVDVHCYDTLE
jgi:hypothetical protein